MPGIEAYEYHLDIVVMINILMLAAFISISIHTGCTHKHIGQYTNTHIYRKGWIHNLGN